MQSDPAVSSAETQSPVRVKRIHRYASLGVGGLVAAVLFHMLCIFDTPSERRTLDVVIAGVASHAAWAAVFGWLCFRVSHGKRVGTALAVLTVNGAMTVGPTILILAGAFKYVGGSISIVAGVLFWVTWVVTLTLLVAAYRTASREKTRYRTSRG